MIPAQVRDAFAGERTSPRTAPDEVLAFVDKEPDDKGVISLPNAVELRIEIYVFPDLDYHLVHSRRYEAVTFLLDAQIAELMNSELVELEKSAEDVLEEAN